MTEKSNNSNYNHIGIVKFFDSIVNNFGYISILNPSKDHPIESVHVAERDLINTPEDYKEGVYVLLNISKRKNIHYTGKAKHKGFKAENVVLLNKVGKQEIEIFIDSIDFSSLKAICKSNGFDFNLQVKKIIEILFSNNLNDKKRNKYYQVIEEHFSTDDALMFFAENDPKHLIDLLENDPKYVTNSSDDLKSKLILSIERQDLIAALANQWELDNELQTIDFIKKLTELDIDKKSIEEFVLLIKSRFSSLGFQLQIVILDFIKEADLCIQLVDDWAIEERKEYQDGLFNWIHINKDDLFLTDNKIKKKLSNSIIMLINKTDPVDEGGKEYPSPITEIDTKDAESFAKSVFGRSKDQRQTTSLQDMRNDLLFSMLNSGLCDWLMPIDEIIDKWRLDSLRNLRKLEDLISQSNALKGKTEFKEKIWSFIQSMGVSSEIVETAIIWDSILGTDNSLQILEKYTLQEPEIIDGLSYQNFIPNSDLLSDYIKENFDTMESLPDKEGSGFERGLILFWMVLIGVGEIPSKQIMSEFFGDTNVPEPLQLIFLKALFKNIHLEIYDRIEVANYIMDFPFTDLSTQLTMVTLKSRKSKNLSDVAKQLNSVFIKSLEKSNRPLFIGNVVKECNGRKRYGGNIWYDEERKTFSFDGGFGLEIDWENSPNQHCINFDEGFQLNDSNDLPF